MSDRQRTRTSRAFARFIVWIDEHTMKLPSDALPDHEPLPDDEFPECPYCERKLGTAPAPNAIAWKCVQHGRFPASEFEPNILRAMQADVTNENESPILQALFLIPFGAFLVLVSLLVSATRRLFSR